MFDSLFARFSRNSASSLPVSDSLSDVPTCRFDIVEYGRVLFSTDDYDEALRSLRVFVGASVMDNGMSAS